MQFLLSIEQLDDITCYSWDAAFSPKEEQQIADVLQMDNINKLTRVNIGPGADLMVILLAINTIAETFLVASKILEGTAAWKKLIAKIKGFIHRQELISIDEDGAKILAIDYLSQHYQYDKIELIANHVINITDISGMIQLSDKLAKRPHNYYVQAYCLDGEFKIILGITSTGDVNLIKAFCLSNYGLEELQDNARCIRPVTGQK